MSSLAIDLFCEDFAHREFIRAMIDRLAGEEHCAVMIRDRSAQGGHGKALTEFDLYQSLLEKHQFLLPDVVVVAIDANCRRFAEAAREIDNHIRSLLQGRAVKACPDPHIERWYTADPVSFQSIVGVPPRRVRRKCERGFYKALLSQAVREAGHPVTLGGIEFAREIVHVMDLNRVALHDRALGRFIGDLRGALRTSLP